MNLRSTLVILVIAGCTLSVSAGPATHAGTAKMAARLEELAASQNPSRSPILNAARAEQFRAQMNAAKDPGAQLQLRVSLGYELTLAGATAEGIDELSRARQDAAGFDGAERVQRFISEMLAVAYLRLGEQENCIDGHNVNSCLLPIQGSGVYTRARATRLAIKEYGALLKEAPDDLGYRWLLNLAYMTLGEYPKNVPVRWRVPPSVFESAFDIKRFVDAAPQLGLAAMGHAGGVVLDDFDGDGYLDIMRSSWGLTEQLRLFHNNADGTFAERTEQAGLIGETSGLNLIQADYNNDGRPDVLVLRGAWLGMAGEGDHPTSLLRNNADGTFDDVTEEAGLLRFHSTQTAAWADYDGDGWLDLFVGVEATGGSTYPCELYHNNHDGTFTEVAAASGLQVVGFVKGVAWGDYDNDGRPDLYISRFGQPNLLLHNDGSADPLAAGDPNRGRGWKFTDVTAHARVAEPINSFATWFFDYDNDGWLDLFVAPFLGFNGKNLPTLVAGILGLPNKGETARLYRNKHDGTFEDVTAAVHLDKALVVMGSNFGDLDNDGFPDIYLGTGEPDLTTLVPNRMFRNDGGRVFQDVTTSGGFGHLQKGHGIAFGDVDNDGNVDVYAVMGGAYEGDVYQNALFMNPGHTAHWIALQLEGVAANRSAIGARVRVATGTNAAIYTTVTSGGSFGASPLRQTIGLGATRAIESIEVRWPGSDRVQRFDGVPMDRRYRLKEGAELVPVSLKRLDLSGRGHATHSPTRSGASPRRPGYFD